MKHRFNQPLVIMIAVVLMASALFATAALSTKPSAGDAVRGRAKAVLRVDGMTCGGCIATIEKSLAGFEGVDDVQVENASGTTEILYDSALAPDVERMAAAITANGYPGTVMRTLSPDPIREQDRANTARSEKAIASVGGVEIPRSDLEIEMAHVHSRYQMAYGENAMASDQDQRLLNNLKVQIARRLVDESIKLQEIRSAGFTVDPSMLAQQYETFWKERGFADQAVDKLRKRTEVANLCLIEQTGIGGARIHAQPLQINDELDGEKRCVALSLSVESCSVVLFSTNLKRDISCL
ncbi:hypothetical protein DSCA_38610 [Desulfosarcina alkanivorans]|uniref:HMA domain-containing protein n=1 Tax=Desulfosarcina alkanivorans TaxID=571177 RepID=A0A5K7YSH3_9BACT|nr:cation transporter [Desulfosarcina alkanivorans]BBO69931.1 hypothetical protein DSCA_38610 [Desulfosarcina alkanivorans]